MASGGGFAEDIDAFEDDSDIDIAGREFHRLRQSRIKDGYRSGFEAGQESTLQSGFNQGYCEGVYTAYQINYMKGLLSALKAYHEQTQDDIFSTSDKHTIREILVELETLEHSYNAKLKQTLSSDESISTTDQSVSASLQGNDEQARSLRSRDDDLSAISHDLKDMHIKQCETGQSELSIGDEVGDYKRTSRDESVRQRLTELSHRCRTLFSQLDIQNLLQ